MNSADPKGLGRPMGLAAPVFPFGDTFVMDASMPCLDLLMDLEARHDDLLARLAELDQRVEKTLAECQAFRVAPAATPADAEPIAAPAAAQAP